MARRYTLTPADSLAIVNTAGRLGIRPDVLASVIAYETMGTMNPSIKGGKGGNYQGLIQFGPPERKRYGYKADASFAEQVEGPVYRYLKDRGVKPGHGVAEVYSVINAGSLKNGKPRWNASDGNGTVRTHVQKIISQYMPRMASLMEGVAPSQPNMDAIADVANYSQADGGDIARPAPETAIALPQNASAAIADLIDAPAGAPVDAMAYNMARAQVAPPMAGGAPTETLVGGDVPNPRMRPDRLAPPAESMVRPNDYIAGLLSGETPETMNAGAYQSRADQMPSPPSRPEANTGFPGQLDYIESGNVPSPTPRPAQQSDIPTPRLRPVETPTSPSLVAGPPPRPIGALPAATPMSDAEFQSVKDEIAALAAKQRPAQPTGMIGPPEANPGSFPETPEQAYDRMTREREQMFADMDARAGQPVPKTDYFSPDFGFAAAPAAPSSFPPTQGAVKAPPLMASAMRLPDDPMAGRFTDAFAPNDNSAIEQALADRQMQGRFDQAFAPAPQLDLNRGSPIAGALDSANGFLFNGAETGLSDVSKWLNSGGTSPAAATPAPLPAPAPSPFPVLPPKDQSRVPESNWFATQAYPAMPKPPVVDTVNPIRIGPSSSIDPTATDMISSLGKPMGATTAAPRYASADFVPLTYDGAYDPKGMSDPVTNDGANYPLTYKPPAPQPISMDAFDSRFGSPQGWQPVSATEATAPIVLPGAPVSSPPSAPPINISPPTVTTAPKAPSFNPPPPPAPQRNRPIGNLLNTLVGNIFGGGGSGPSWGPGAAATFTQMGGGSHPSGQSYSTGTIGSTNWDAGQYENSKGKTVTYATDPWQGGYMVSPF